MALTGNYEPGYPAVATNAAWQKKKSFLDKAKKAAKTGLGARLLAAQAAYDKVKFELLDAEQVAEHLEETSGESLLGQTNQIEVLMQQAKNAAYTHQRAVVSVAVDALKLAETTAKEVVKNPALTPAAQNAAKIIAAELHEHAAALLRIQHDTLDDFATQTEKLKESFSRG